MTDLVQEISTDYDHDDSEVVFDEAFGDDINRLNSDVKEGNMMEEELRQLMDTALALEKYGMNPPTFGVMKTMNLLSGTSLEALAMESFSFTGPEDPESQMALEAIVEKIKEKAAAWSAKILTFSKLMADKVTGRLNVLWTKITDTSKALTDKAWDNAEALGREIKAHPFKTIMIVIAAAAAVAAIAALVASGAPGAYANETALKSFMFKIQDLIGKIKWPFGKLATELAPDGSRIVCHITKTESANSAATVKALGWSKEAVKSATAQLNKVWGVLKTGVGAAGTKIAASAKVLDKGADAASAAVEEKVVGATKSKLVGWASKEAVKRVYMTALWSVLGTLYMLLKEIVLKAFTMVAETFTSLKPAANKAKEQAA